MAASEHISITHEASTSKFKYLYNFVVCYNEVEKPNHSLIPAKLISLYLHSEEKHSITSI